MNADRLESLVMKVRSLKDEVARDTALQLVQAVMDLHGTGLTRMMDLISESECGGALMNEFATDSPISAILLLHDLHPVDFETRVRRAVIDLRGGSIRILSIEDGIVRLEVDGGATAGTQVRTAVLEAAPDAVEVIIETHIDSTFVPIEQLMAR